MAKEGQGQRDSKARARGRTREWQVEGNIYSLGKGQGHVNPVGHFRLWQGKDKGNGRGKVRQRQGWGQG